MEIIFINVADETKKWQMGAAELVRQTALVAVGPAVHHTYAHKKTGTDVPAKREVVAKGLEPLTERI